MQTLTWAKHCQFFTLVDADMRWIYSSSWHAWWVFNLRCQNLCILLNVGSFSFQLSGFFLLVVIRVFSFLLILGSLCFWVLLLVFQPLLCHQFGFPLCSSSSSCMPHPLALLSPVSICAAVSQWSLFIKLLSFGLKSVKQESFHQLSEAIRTEVIFMIKNHFIFLMKWIHSSVQVSTL